MYTRRRRPVVGVCRQFVWQQLKSALTFLGIVFFTVGGWDLLDLDIHRSLPNFPDHGESVGRDIAMSVAGLVLLALSGSYFGNAGIGVLRPRAIPTTLVGKVSTAFRCQVALWASLVYWVGVYNLFDVYVPQAVATQQTSGTVAWEFGCVVFGVCALGLSGGLVPKRKLINIYETTWKQCVCLYLRGLVSLISFPLAWKGVNNILMFYLFPQPTAWIIQVMYGALGYISMNAVNACNKRHEKRAMRKQQRLAYPIFTLEEEETDDETDPVLLAARDDFNGVSMSSSVELPTAKLTMDGGLDEEIQTLSQRGAVLCCQLLLSVLGVLTGLLCWTGMFNSLDALGKEDNVRNAFFVVIGLVLLLVTGAVSDKAGLGVPQPMWVVRGGNVHSFTAYSALSLADEEEEEEEEGEEGTGIGRAARLDL